MERRRARRNRGPLTVEHWKVSDRVRGGGAHRRPSDLNTVYDRVVVAGVAAGAIVSSGSVLATQYADATGEHMHLVAHEEPINPADQSGEVAAPTPGLPGPVALGDDVALESATAMASALVAGTEIDTQRQVAEETARRPTAVMPTVGTFTSGFGQRWDAIHGGIDIANAIGTPIVAATEGTIIDAGPAQGFGNWIRLLSDEGTMTVYGHMEEVLVPEGQRVQAGQTIALMGNRGFSTGSHLHFEVWSNAGSERVNPLEWLRQNGVAIDTNNPVIS